MQEDQPQQSSSLFSNFNVETINDESNDLKKKREEYANEIRQKDREQMLNLKRKGHPLKQQQQQLSMIPLNLPIEVQNQLKEQIDSLSKKNFTFDEFPLIIQAISSEDLIQQHWGVTGLRKILSVESGPPIQPVIDSNLVPKLIDIINKNVSPQLTLEAAWALTNVASGTTQQTQTIIDKGGISMFVKLLQSNYPDIAEQAVWAIGNIAGDCSQYRDLILRSGGVDPLITIIKDATNKSTVKHGTWALSNLCRGKPLPEYRFVRNATPIFCRVIIEETDQEVLVDACWALSYLSDGDSIRVQPVIDSGVVPTLIRILDHPHLTILIPALRILGNNRLQKLIKGNIVTGDDKQTNYVLDQGILGKLVNLLKHEKKPVRREACWTISNITAGNANQISAVVRDTNIIERLFYLMKNDAVEIRREASWAISNATTHGSGEDMRYLVQLGLLELFVELMDLQDVKTLTVILEATLNVLKKGDADFENDNLYLTKLESLQGIAKIEKLQKHENREVYQKCFNILERYYEPMVDL